MKNEEEKIVSILSLSLSTLALGAHHHHHSNDNAVVEFTLAEQTYLSILDRVDPGKEELHQRRRQWQRGGRNKSAVRDGNPVN